MAYAIRSRMTLGIAAALAAAAFPGSHRAQAADEPRVEKLEDDCIENIAGRIVCGANADAVRARLRIEERLRREGKDPYGDASLYSSEGVVEPTAISATGALSADMMDARQDPIARREERRPTQSIYQSFGQSVFVRGGYVFSAHGGGQNGSISAPLVGAGLIKPIRQWGAHRLNLEFEAVYFGDSEELIVLGAPIETSIWSVTALATLRYRYVTGSVLDPYLSVGVGPAYYRGRIDDGVTSVSDGEFSLGYSGRAGLIATLSDRFSIEAGYRYLGAARDETIGVHAGEVGLNLGF